MAVPKKKKTRSARNQRRNHHALEPIQLITCSKCGKPVRPHTVCANCGSYKGRTVITVRNK